MLCRNIFEGKKYVEEYRVQDVASELGMTRDKLIQLALLLGSDYTEGVAGIGIVNAVEIVNAFPTEEMLINFRSSNLHTLYPYVTCPCFLGICQACPCMSVMPGHARLTQ